MTLRAGIRHLKGLLLGSRQGFKDTIVSMLPQILSLVSGIVTTILIARGLGPEGLGLYGLILSVPSFLIGISDLGIAQTAIRFAAEAASRGDQEGQLRVLRWAFRLRLLIILGFSAVAMLIMPFLANMIWKRPEITGLLFFALLNSFANVLHVVPGIYFQTLGRFKMNSLIRSLQVVISFSGIILIAVLQSWKVDFLVYLTIAASGLAAFVFIAQVPRRALYDREEFTDLWRQGWRALIKAPASSGHESASKENIGSFAAYMMVSSIMVSITMQLDMWLMGGFLKDAQIGLYGAAVKFTLPLLVLLGAVNTALWPRVAKLKAKAEIGSMLGRVFTISSLVFLAALVYTIFFPILIPVLFGERFNAGIEIGQVLSLRYAIALLCIPVSVIGYSLGMVRHYWWINIVQFVIVLTVNVLLLPVIGAMGAAIALVANEVVGAILSCIMLVQRYRSTENLEGASS